MKFETIVTLKITEDIPDKLIKRPCSNEEFCENLKSLIESELYETGQVEILEDFVHVVRCKDCVYSVSENEDFYKDVIFCSHHGKRFYENDYCSNGEHI